MLGIIRAIFQMKKLKFKELTVCQGDRRDVADILSRICDTKPHYINF